MDKIVFKSGFITVLLVFISVISIAQIGGRQTYQFLNLTNSARIAGLGGDFLAIKDQDITLTLANPSLITSEMHNDLSLSFVNYFGGSNYGYVMYSRNFKKAGPFVGTFQYINYGTFTRADETGVKAGDFTASEYALNIGWARQLGPLFSIGANGKFIYSSLDSYNSLGIAVDVAGTYQSKNELFTASLIARNMGIQILTYRESNREPLPFEMRAGVSFRFKYIPFRVSVLYNHIEKWDLDYDVYTDSDTISRSGINKFADNFMRHIVIGGELTIAKVVFIRLGYNYQRRQEMKVYEQAGLLGFTGGLGLRIKMFDMSYTFFAGPYHPNYFTLTVNLGGFKKKESK